MLEHLTDLLGAVRPDSGVGVLAIARLLELVGELNLLDGAVRLVDFERPLNVFLDERNVEAHMRHRATRPQAFEIEM